jgi:hypothetical protein
MQIDIHGVAGSLSEFPWRNYSGPDGVIKLDGNEYKFFTFPTGFSAHWVRFVASGPGRVSTTLHYT